MDAKKESSQRELIWEDGSTEERRDIFSRGDAEPLRKETQE
jgi:hypothetical protein